MNNSNRTNKKSIGTTILILVVGLAYIAAKPKLEKWLGTELPGGGNQNQQQAAPDLDLDLNSSVAATDSNSSTATNDDSVLTRDGGVYKSKEGLVYKANSSTQGHDHVLLHAKDNLSKPVHGVFSDKSKVFALVDEAYKKIKSGSKDAREERQGSKLAYTVKMGRKIGYKGGFKGKEQGHPKTTRLKLILVEGNRVITAYPY